jgi:acetyl esterase
MMSDQARPKPDAIVAYKSTAERELSLHIFQPLGEGSGEPKPALVFFFGGGWKGGSPEQFYHHCRHFASRGMVAMAAEYRTEKPDGTSPKECVKDGKSAIRWVREHAPELGIDPNQVVGGGGSAGGHVAAACATLMGFNEDGEDVDTSSVPDALVLFNPVFDNGPGGYGHDRVEGYWEEFSPMHNLSDISPPTIVLMGTEDNLLPVETGEEYKGRMEELGRRCDLILYDGQKHGFFNHGSSLDNYQKTVKAADDFLVSLGLLQP